LARPAAVSRVEEERKKDKSPDDAPETGSLHEVTDSENNSGYQGEGLIFGDDRLKSGNHNGEEKESHTQSDDEDDHWIQDHGVNVI